MVLSEIQLAFLLVIFLNDLNLNDLGKQLLSSKPNKYEKINCRIEFDSVV